MAKIKNPITVVQAGGSILGTKSITSNGTYNASSDALDGYSSVTVNVPPTLFRSLIDRSITSVTEDDLDGVTSIENYAFYACRSLVSIVLPNNITKIGTNAFQNNSALTAVSIPDSVTSIGEQVFAGCTSLNSLHLGSGISTILYRGFYGCSSLTFVIVPVNITSLSNNAFGSCSSMNKFVFLATTPPPIESQNVFFNTNNCPIYVPTPDTYRNTTNWMAVLDGNNQSRIFPLVSTVADLSNIDTTTYTKACVVGVDESYKEYSYDGSQWNEVV